ncbi:LURP-one-related/scramblase family protein [Actinocorallia aurea]
MFRNKTENASTTVQFQMQQRMLSFGDDFWIENGVGQRVYRVNGKMLRLRRTFLLEDANGDELLKVHQKALRLRETFVIERGGETVATLHKALVGIRNRFKVSFAEGGDLRIQGNILDHDYGLTRDGTDVAQVSKRWVRARDTYTVAIAEGEDFPVILAAVVCIDALTHGGR